MGSHLKSGPPGGDHGTLGGSIAGVVDESGLGCVGSDRGVGAWPGPALGVVLEGAVFGGLGAEREAGGTPLRELPFHIVGLRPGVSGVRLLVLFKVHLAEELPRGGKCEGPRSRFYLVLVVAPYHVRLWRWASRGSWADKPLEPFPGTYDCRLFRLCVLVGVIVEGLTPSGLNARRAYGEAVFRKRLACGME